MKETHEKPEMKVEKRSWIIEDEEKVVESKIAKEDVKDNDEEIPTFDLALLAKYKASN